MAAVLKIIVKKGRADDTSSPFQYSKNSEGIESVGSATHRDERLPLDLENNFSPSNPPSLLLHLWSVLPVLLIATGDVGLASIALLVALINFFLIQVKTKTVIRYMSSGFVSSIPFLLYFLVN